MHIKMLTVKFTTELCLVLKQLKICPLNQTEKEVCRLKVTKLIRVLLVIKKMYIYVFLLANLNLLTCYRNLENSCYEPH